MVPEGVWFLVIFGEKGAQRCLKILEKSFRPLFTSTVSTVDFPSEIS
jgi:hypothetical protein